jgi:hypothetical protein
MATNFPASLDSLTNPSSSDSLNSPSHSAQHANSNDAIEALQAKVGADGSAVTSSHDYLIGDHASRLTTLEALGTAVAFTPSWTNFTLGNGTEEWYSTRIGDLVIVTGRVVYGSTSSIAANSFGFAPPVTPAFVISGNLRLIDVGTGTYIGRIYFHTDNNFRFTATYSAGTGYVTSQQIVNTSPYTFVSGDWFDASIVYQAAT